jgi:hypothetical protein
MAPLYLQAVFQSKTGAQVASEAAIASNLVHDNIVSTYSHDIRRIESAEGVNELEIYKFYLIQECAPCQCCPEVADVFLLMF